MFSYNVSVNNLIGTLCTNKSTLMFDNGNGSSPRSANLSLSYHCEISSTTVAASCIEPSVTSITSITSMTSTDVISTPSPSPITCSTDGIWSETLPGHNAITIY